jgi:hypothetical protein
MRSVRSILLVMFAVSLFASSALAEDYVLGPDSQPEDGVPKGTVTKHTFDTSEVFKGTTRSY